MDPVMIIDTARQPIPYPAPYAEWRVALGKRGFPAAQPATRQGLAQWKESPQAQEPVALGLSIVKPCFSIVSTKSMVAPLR